MTIANCRFQIERVASGSRLTFEFCNCPSSIVNLQSLRARFNSLPGASLADRLVLRGGTRRDYDALAEFHYRAKRPATVTRVLVLEDRHETRGSRLEEWSRSLKSQASSGKPLRPVAVLVESMPTINCQLRDRATGGRYAGMDRSAAIRLLNAEVRCISRVVVDPRWRGLGLAVRLVKHALGTAATRHTEAMAAMGRVHPLFELAGMTRHEADDDRPVYYIKHKQLAASRLISAGQSPTMCWGKRPS